MSVLSTLKHAVEHVIFPAACRARHDMERIDQLSEETTAIVSDFNTRVAGLTASHNPITKLARQMSLEPRKPTSRTRRAK